jgi:hypothetical protein
MKDLYTLILVLISPIVANGQSILLEGQILDQEELTPIHAAHIIINEKTASVTQLKAEFSLMVNPHDTLVISHIGYKKSIFVVPENAPMRLDTTFFMTKDTTFLKEINIYAFPTERGFKQQIMTTYVLTKELINAQNNIYQSQQMYKYGVVAGMDALDNYKTFTEGPQPVVFFSTNSSMGINKALQKAFTSQPTINTPKRGLSQEESTQLMDNLKLNAKIPDEDSIKFQPESIVSDQGDNK